MEQIDRNIVERLKVEKEILSEYLICFGKTLIANFINKYCINRNEIEECKKKIIKFIQDFK